MKINEKGLALIKTFESCRLEAYPDPATKAEPYTIGWGATGQGIKLGVKWTQEQADARLQNDVNKLAVTLQPLVKSAVNDNQFSAMVCFAYNVGLGSLKNSTLLKLVNEGKFAKAADEFPKWNKAAGKVMKGLVARRAAERELFLA